MALVFKSFYLTAVFVLLLVNASEQDQTTSVKGPEVSGKKNQAPFLNNVDAINNLKIVKVAKNTVDATVDGIKELVSEYADQMNENHAKTGGKIDPNSITPNIIKYNVVEPGKAVNQVNLKRISSFVSEINDSYREHDKAPEGQTYNAYWPAKRMIRKPISLGKAARDVILNKASNIIGKIKDDKKSKEIQNEDKNNKKPVVERSEKVARRLKKKPAEE